MSLTLSKDSKYKLNSGHEIPVIGLGVYLTPQDVASKIVYKALEDGYRHIDSAIAYKNESEVVEGIAKFLKDHPEVKRSEIYYTTKINAPNQGYEQATKTINESLEKAAAIDYIDLFLIHAPNTNKELRLGTWKALQEFADKGKVKSIGVSNYGKHHIEEIYNWDGFKIAPSINQIELNPWLTRKDLVDYLKSKDILPEAYSPLTRGKRLDDPELQKLAEKYNKTTAQVLVRWSLDQGYITLPKTVNEERLLQNLELLDFKISEEDLKALTHDDEYYVTNPSWDPVTYQG